MYPISAQYEQFLRKRTRTWLLKADIDGVEYGSSSIISFDIENSLVSGNEFEIGTAIVSKLVLKLKTNSEITDNARVVPYLGLSLADMTWLDADVAWDDADFPWAGGETEWLPLGEFYIDSREKINNSWIFTCYDKLMTANVTFISQLTYPATMQDVWDEICTSLEYVSASSVQINPDYMFQVGPAGFTKRQILGYIASANAASTFMGRDGKIEFRRYSAEEEPVYDIGPSDYIRAMQTNPIKTYSRVVVTYDTEDELTYEAGTGDENHTLYIENPFATQEMTDDILAALNGFSYMPIMMDARGYPQIEAGDRIRFSRDESIAWLDANTPWQDMDLPWDGIVYYQTLALHVVYSFKGGLKMAIDAPSKSEQQSEFQVDGTLTTAVNRLNQSAVKQGKAYFGVTITRTDGLTIEREDHASKVILNSDKMTFQVDGEDKIYFDPVSGKYKFNGTLEASDGVFSGSLSAATGTFSGSLSAATGTFSGDLSAAGGTFTGTLIGVDGTFSGTISASSFIGGTITGTTITGGTIQSDTIGKRIEMTSGKINLYNSDNTLGMRMDSITAQPLVGFYESGVSKGSLFRSTNQTTMTSSGNTLIDTSGDLILFGGSSVFLWSSSLVEVSGPFRVNGGSTFDSLSQSDSIATTTSGIVSDFNSLLSKLRSMNILA